MQWWAIVLAVLVPTGLVLAAAAWLKGQFPGVARAALKEMGQEFLTLAKGDLAAERQKGLGDLEVKRQAIEHNVKTLEAQLATYQQLLKDFEADRNQKYGQLQSELEKLHHNTGNLIAILGNSRVRGQWGQRMAQDILRYCGLQENLQYRCELQISAGRPDYTFFLPDQHKVFMDVKFPLEHYLKSAGAIRDDEQRLHKEAFIRDVREHLREMERRDYAQSEQSLDYIIIFIPNEQVYGLINEWIPGLIDECLSKKIILSGPWSLYAIVRVIAQAWQNYHSSQAIEEIVRAISAFLQDYAKFTQRFGEFGELIEKLQKKHQEIAMTSHQRLETRIRRIEEYRKGQQIPEPLAVESGTDQLMKIGEGP